MYYYYTSRIIRFHVFSALSYCILPESIAVNFSNFLQNFFFFSEYIFSYLILEQNGRIPTKSQSTVYYCISPYDIIWYDIIYQCYILFEVFIRFDSIPSSCVLFDEVRRLHSFVLVIAVCNFSVLLHGRSIVLIDWLTDWLISSSSSSRVE